MIPTRYYKFADIALQLAEEADNSMTHSLCALVVKKSRVISIGYNSRKTSPKMTTRMQMYHAEYHAILRCSESDLRGCDVVVARARSKGQAGLARPCSACEATLRERGIRRVIYTTNYDDSATSAIEIIRL